MTESPPQSLAEEGLDMLHDTGCITRVWECLTPYERIDLGAFWERWRKSMILRPSPEAALAALLSAGLREVKRN